MCEPALFPSATLFPPEATPANAELPTALLPDPVVLPPSAKFPSATLLDPVVFLPSAKFPSAVLNPPAVMAKHRCDCPSCWKATIAGQSQASNAFANTASPCEDF